MGPVAFAECAFIVTVVIDIKTRAMSMGEKPATVNPREDGTAQILAIVSTPVWNVLKKIITSILKCRCWTDRLRKASAVDNRTIVWP